MMAFNTVSLLIFLNDTLAKMRYGLINWLIFMGMTFVNVWQDLYILVHKICSIFLATMYALIIFTDKANLFPKVQKFMMKISLSCL